MKMQMKPNQIILILVLLVFAGLVIWYAVSKDKCNGNAPSVSFQPRYSGYSKFPEYKENYTHLDKTYTGSRQAPPSKHSAPSLIMENRTGWNQGLVGGLAKNPWGYYYDDGKVTSHPHNTNAGPGWAYQDNDQYKYKINQPPRNPKNMDGFRGFMPGVDVPGNWHGVI
jgi:hypothetical protein